MKILIAAILFSSFAIAASSEKDVKEVSSRETLAKEKLKALNIKEDEEDCDEKAKEPVAIVPESISLSGDAGCTLPE